MEFTNDSYEQHVLINKIHNNNGAMQVLSELSNRVKTMTNYVDILAEIEKARCDVLIADEELTGRLEELQAV